METNPVALIFKEGDSLVACGFDASAATPVADLIQSEPVGPFLIEAEVASPENHKIVQKVSMLAAVSHEELHVMLPAIPIFLKGEISWTRNAGTIVRFLELSELEYAKSTYDISFMLPASRFRSKFFYFKFTMGKMASIITGMWDDKMVKTVPFYNFQTDGTSCMGGTHGASANSMFSRLLCFMNGYTQPHDTYGSGTRYSLKAKAADGSKSPTKAQVEKELKENTFEPDLVFGNSLEDFCKPYDLTAIKPPAALATEESRKKVLGKLQPLI